MKRRRSPNPVIPNEVEGSRGVTFKLAQRDPSVRAGLAFLLGMTHLL
jgi:hypothetical protein